MREVIETLVADSLAEPLVEPTPRRVRLPALPGKADVVVGMRRSGKTWLLFDQMRRLLAEGLDRSRMLYLNFEDERLLPMTAGDLALVPEAYFRRHPENHDRPCWFFLDEIQNVAGWERFVRRMLDQRRHRFVLTGSSATLFSGEIATSMRGRSLTTELLPFGFDEWLRHHGLAIPERWPPPAGQRARLERAFLDYLDVGGFPEVQGVEAALRRRILQDYVHAVLLRDVAERHRIVNVAILRALARQLLAGPAAAYTVNRLFHALKSQGLRVSKDAVYEHVRQIEDAYLFCSMEVDDESERVRQSRPRKCEVIDPGLARAVSWRAAQDRGHLLENVVYLELRRRGAEPRYVVTRAGHEVDFLARWPDGSRELVQVCESLARPDTRERELRALEEAFAEGRAGRAVVVTLHEEETVRVKRRSVRVVPAWRWMLEARGAVER
ncbi:MAG: ATP-binding protein [Deltaproteobacteria bacterium]|nr:ATP-binding protein [Deltaproteobacteria bacterium]